MHHYVYDTLTGVVVGGPVNQLSDAQRSASRKPNQDVIVAQNKFNVELREKRVDLITLLLRAWTTAELNAAIADDVAKETDKKNKKDAAKNGKGQGNSVPELRDRVDNIIEVLQDMGMIPK